MRESEIQVFRKEYKKLIEEYNELFSRYRQEIATGKQNNKKLANKLEIVVVKQKLLYDIFTKLGIPCNYLLEDVPDKETLGGYKPDLVDELNLPF